MMTTNRIVKRKIIKIDEEKCDGCGECVPNCPEGAIQIINGKAKLVNEPNCDGLGACIGHCPRGAITIEERETVPYDEVQVVKEILRSGDNSALIKHIEHLKEHNEHGYLKQAREYLREIGHPLADKCVVEERMLSLGGCPGLKSVSFEPLPAINIKSDVKENRSTQSCLRHWPVQLHLINPAAAHYKRSNLLVAADCVPFAMDGFHQKYLDGKSLVIACPKLDHGQEIYLQKLKRLIDEAEIDTITVIIMEVPCCFGLMRLVQQARAQSNRHVPIKLVVVSIRGEVIKEEWMK